MGVNAGVGAAPCTGPFYLDFLESVLCEGCADLFGTAVLGCARQATARLRRRFLVALSAPTCSSASHRALPYPLGGWGAVILFPESKHTRPFFWGRAVCPFLCPRISGLPQSPPRARSLHLLLSACRPHLPSRAQFKVSSPLCAISMAPLPLLPCLTPKPLFSPQNSFPR